MTVHNVLYSKMLANVIAGVVMSHTYQLLVHIIILTGNFLHTCTIIIHDSLY